MTDKETLKKFDFGSCCSMMGELFKSKSEEGMTKSFNMEKCQEMMKQCCGEGKFDFQSFRTKMAKFFEQTGKETSEKENTRNES